MLGLSLALATSALAAGATEMWCGTITFKPYCDMSPLNITVDTEANTATVDWRWDEDAGRRCTMKHEPDLKVVTTGQTIEFQGTGADPKFYSLTGTLNAAGNMITGKLNKDGQGKTSFTVTKGAPPVHKKCTPGPAPAPHHHHPPGPPGPPPAPGPWAPKIWPLPQQFTNGSTTLVVDASNPQAFFKLGGGATSKTLTAAFARYAKLTLPHPTAAPDLALTPRAGVVRGCVVTVADLSEAHPQLTTDESYALTVAGTGEIAITAKTIYGALHGLETLSQLVVYDFDQQQHTLPLAPWAITDAPRFAHRGLMIDTSRHFETVNTIKRMITSLAFSKVNVLHWHMSDSQSFPFESKTHPKLWEASWSVQERYTQLDIAAVIEFARMRGVRVMVEFDMPGHAGSWCKGYPEVCPSPTCTQPLNPASPKTFQLITEMLGEITGMKTLAGLFPETMIHLGGDEVHTKCWTREPSIMAWLQAHNLTTDGGYGYFVNKTAHIAVAQGRRPIQWNEVWDHFGTALPKEAIVHAWNDRSAMAKATSAGYSALNSQGWYLDHLTSSWESMYTNDPQQGVDPSKSALVLGGQGEMWGETVDTSDIEQTVWPRMAAIGEMLWSSQSVTNSSTATGSAYPRLSAFRCLLNRRGVRAAPLLNSGAREAPHGPGGCLEQR